MHGRSWICSYTVTPCYTQRSQSTLRLASCQPSFVDRSSWVGWCGMHWQPIGGFVLTFWQEYTAGFYTDIESESLPKGLNEAQHMAPRHPDSTLLTQADSRKFLPALSLGFPWVVFRTVHLCSLCYWIYSFWWYWWRFCQDIVRKIWEIKEEPDWMLEYRLNAFRTKQQLRIGWEMLRRS